MRFVILLIGLVLGAAIWIALEPAGGPPARPSESTLRIGNWLASASPAAAEWQPEASAGDDAQRYVANEAASLERDGLKLSAEAGSVVRLIGDEVELVKGRAELRAERASRFGDFELQRYGVLELESESARILAGKIAIGGQLFGPGTGFVRIEGRWLPQPESVTARAPDESASPVSVAVASGRLIDAQTGVGLAGLAIDVVLTHSNDGYPALPQNELTDPADVDAPRSRTTVTSDASGYFTIPPFGTYDPRLKVHLQISALGYRTHAEVIQQSHDIAGRWPFTRVELRRANTYQYRFYDLDHRPLAHHAVLIQEQGSPFVVEDLWRDERTNSTPAPTVMYTDADGHLELARHWQSVALIPDPLLREFDESEYSRPSWLVSELAELTRIPLEFRPEIKVFGPRNVAQRYWLVDRDSNPVSSRVIEVKCDDVWFRTYTDGDGSFVLSIEQLDSAPSVRTHPRLAELLVIDPSLWRQRHRFEMPSSNDRLYADRRLAMVMRLRLLDPSPKAATGALPIPVAAYDLRTSADLTWTYRDTDAFVELTGSLPASVSRLWITARDHLPAEIALPLNRTEILATDLGDVVLDPGLSVELRLAGVDPELFPHVRLLLTDRRYQWRSSEYVLDRSGRVRVGGLETDQGYDYTLRGPGILEARGQFWVSDDTLADGVDIAIERSTEVETRVRGFVSGLTNEETNEYRVIERYYRNDVNDPRIVASYPLAPDGRFGSVRVMERPTHAEVFVIRFAGQFGHIPPKPFLKDTERNGAWSADLDIGRVVMQPPRVCRLHFRYDNAFPAPVPQVELTAQVDRNHEIVDLIRQDSTLEIRNVLAGKYHLTWTGDDGEVEGHAFEIQPEESEHEDVVELTSAGRYEVLLSVVDPDGKPVRSVSIGSEPVDSVVEYESRRENIALHRALSDTGNYRVEFIEGRHNLVAIEPEDSAMLAQQLLVPDGVGFDTAIQLERAVTIEGKVFDTNRQVFKGPLEASWKHDELPLEAGADGVSRRAAARRVGNDDVGAVLRVHHGRNLVFRVLNGQFSARGAPQGERLLRFEHVDSDAAATLRAKLNRGTTNVGSVHLEERRSLTGEVWLPSGEPATGARIALVARHHAWRLPLHPIKSADYRYASEVDAYGRFTIDGLPIDLTEPLALVAHLDGYVDAVEDPVDLDAKQRVLELRLGNVLDIRAGYAEEGDHDDYRFRLSHRFAELDPPRRLGAVPAGEVLRVRDVTPGWYRLEWDLKGSYPGSKPSVAEVYVGEGTESVLDLRLDLSFEQGTAYFNGKPLRKGWVLLTDDPGDASRRYYARVRNGEFTAPVPASAANLFATVIPDESPLPIVDFETGQGWPTEVDRIGDRLEVGYVGYRLTLRFAAEMLTDNPKLTVEFPRYVWVGGRWQQDGFVESAVSGSKVVHTLLRAGIHRFNLDSGRSIGWRSQHSTEIIDKDVSVTLTH